MRIVLLTLGRHGKRGKEVFALGCCYVMNRKVHRTPAPTPQVLVATYAKFSRVCVCITSRLSRCSAGPRAGECRQVRQEQVLLRHTPLGGGGEGPKWGGAESEHFVVSRDRKATEPEKFRGT